MLNLNQNSKRQAGFTLIEALIGLALSLVVVTSMVGLMSNSLGSASKIIQMTQLSDELRNTMSMVSRDIRRANYNAAAYKCYANSECGADPTSNQDDILTINGANDCLIFNLDRDQNGDGSADGAGGFRLSDDGGPGYIEMWVGDASPTCGDGLGGDWIPLTDPEFVEITTFWVDDLASITGSVLEEGGITLNQQTRQINVQIAGSLLLNSNITRSVEDTIKVRNDRIWRDAP
jgi:type II secretory pathway component PulJ